MVHIPQGYLDHSIASSHALYTYLGASVGATRERAHGLVYLKIMTDVLAQLLPHIDSRRVAETTVQLGGNAIEIGIDGQVKGLLDCLSALPKQCPQVPPLPCSISMFVFVSTD